ncbi:hypothetical protein YPPY36_1319, partial [Yersinia pestis PY-36]
MTIATTNWWSATAPPPLM